MRPRAAVGVALALVVLGSVVPVAAGAGAGPATGAGAGTEGTEADASTASTGSGASASADAAVQCAYPFRATDATGTEVTVETAPERVVTLAPSAAQTMWELDASGKVVGLSDNALYLDGADEKEVVVDGQNVRVEAVVGLEPDVVLAPNVVSNETVEKLRDSGLTVFRFQPAGDFEGIYRKTELIGHLAGECEAAASTVADMRQRVDAVREAVSDEERPGALYSFFGFTAGEGTFIDTVLTTAGTRNVAAEVGISWYAQLSDEVIANNSAEIEWLVLNSDPSSHPGGGVYNETTAVREDQVVVLNVHYLNQPAPRTVLALENLTRAVHPEAYEEAQASLVTPTPTPTPTPTVTATPSSTTAASAGDGTATATPTPVAETGAPTAADGEDGTGTATASGAGPGFTAATGVLAVLTAALLARRRR